MHPNFHFTAVQILWTLTFAAQIVLLVVLLGRDRMKKFPWFTIAIILMAVRLLASRLLFGKMAPATLTTIFIAMADIGAIAGFMVIVEMGRRAFVGLSRKYWAIGALVILAIGIGVLAAWGPWPAWKTLTAESATATLRLLQFGAQKLDMLIDVLTIELLVAVLLFGRRYTGGWRTHVQRIVIGLATASMTQLAVQAIWQHIAKTASPHSQAEYDKILALRDKLFNANGAIYVVVLIWWIAVLWIDEAGGDAGTAGLGTPLLVDEPDEVPLFGELGTAGELATGMAPAAE